MIQEHPIAIVGHNQSKYLWQENHYILRSILLMMTKIINDHVHVHQKNPQTPHTQKIIDQWFSHKFFMRYLSSTLRPTSRYTNLPWLPPLGPRHRRSPWRRECEDCPEPSPESTFRTGRMVCWLKQPTIYRHPIQVPKKQCLPIMQKRYNLVTSSFSIFMSSCCLLGMQKISTVHLVQ